MPKAKKKPSRHKCVFYLQKPDLSAEGGALYHFLAHNPIKKDGWEGKMWYSRPLVKTRWLVSHGCIR